MRNEERSLHYGLISKYRPVLMSVAILLIMFCHLDTAQNHNDADHTRLAGFLQTGSVGVDIFLFLSGIGLYFSYTKKPLPYWQFEKKRLLRILPYYLVIGGVTLFIHDILIRHAIDSFFRDLFFISWLTRGSTIYWYVPAIFFFYLLFPAMYLFLHRKNQPLLVPVLLGVVWFALAEFLCHVSETINHFRIALERLPIFVLGVYIGKAVYEKKAIRSTRYIYIYIFTGFLMLSLQKRVLPHSLVSILHYPIRASLAISIISVVILFMELLENKTPKLYTVISKALGCYGALTYELYLLHQSFMILFDYPYELHAYLLVAVVLPSLAAAGIWWARKKLKQRKHHESIQHL